MRTRFAWAVFAGLVVWVAASAAGAQTSPQDRARELFRQGVALLRQSRHADAIEPLARAHEVATTVAVEFNLGLALRGTGRVREALERFRHVVADTSGALRPARRQEAEDYVRELNSAVGRVVLTAVPEGAVVTIDGEPRVPRDGVVEVDPGPIVVAVAHGGARTERAVQVDAGATVTVDTAVANPTATSAGTDATATATSSGTPGTGTTTSATTSASSTPSTPRVSRASMNARVNARPVAEYDDELTRPADPRDGGRAFRRGLVISGAVLFGASAAYANVLGVITATGAGASAAIGGTMMVPVLGPVVAVAFGSSTSQPVIVALGLPSTILQLTGVILFSAGLAVRITNPPSTPRATSVAIVPFAVQGAGGNASGAQGLAVTGGFF